MSDIPSDFHSKEFANWRLKQAIGYLNGTNITARLETRIYLTKLTYRDLLNDGFYYQARILMKHIQRTVK